MQYFNAVQYCNISVNRDVQSNGSAPGGAPHLPGLAFSLTHQLYQPYLDIKCASVSAWHLKYCEMLQYLSEDHTEHRQNTSSAPGGAPHLPGLALAFTHHQLLPANGSINCLKMMRQPPPTKRSCEMFATLHCTASVQYFSTGPAGPTPKKKIIFFLKF